MRDNIALLFVIILFIIGYFKFTSQINRDKFVDIRNIGNIALDPYVLTEKICGDTNQIVGRLSEDYF
jgi:hypothetical protein